MPSCSARGRPAVEAHRRLAGAVGRISISRQPTPRTPEPEDLADRLLGGPAAGDASPAVAAAVAPARRRSGRGAETAPPKRASDAAIRSTLMMSMPDLVTRHRRLTRERRLLDRDRLGQVARLVDVRAPRDRHVVGEQLERDDREDRATAPRACRGPTGRRRRSASISSSPSVATAITGAVAGAALHDVADQLVVDRASGSRPRPAGTRRRAARSGRA